MLPTQPRTALSLPWIPAASAFASGEGRGGFTSRRRRKAAQRVHSLRPPKSRSWLNSEGRSWIASARSNGWPVRACRCPSESERNSAVRLGTTCGSRNRSTTSGSAVRRAPCTIPVYYRLLELSPEAGKKHIRRSPDMQASAMRRKGIAGRLIARDAAVRAANRHAVMRLRWAGAQSPNRACRGHRPPAAGNGNRCASGLERPLAGPERAAPLRRAPPSAAGAGSPA